MDDSKTEIVTEIKREIQVFDLRFSHIQKLISESCEIEPNLNCNSIFHIDLAQNAIYLDTKSIENMQLESKFGSIQQHSRINFALC